MNSLRELNRLTMHRVRTISRKGSPSNRYLLRSDTSLRALPTGRAASCWFVVHVATTREAGRSLQPSRVPERCHPAGAASADVLLRDDQESGKWRLVLRSQ